MIKNRQQFFHKPDLLKQARDLFHRGGPYKKAGEKILAIVSLISQGDPNPLHGLKTTNHGETRLDKCVKYGLASACRLVTVQDDNKIILLFAGDHDEEEKWLNANRGRRFVSDKFGQIDEIKAPSETIQNGERFAIPMNYSPGYLYQLLPDLTYRKLIADLPDETINRIAALHCFSLDDDLFDAVEKIKDNGKKDLIFDVLVSLKEHNQDEALRRIAFYHGELDRITEKTLSESERVHAIPDDDPAYAELFSHFVRTAHYKQWMLYLHPDQKKVVDVDFKGESKLLGVSGSGKTCVVVKRAVRLAKKYSGEKILVLTLNHSLSLLIRELIDVTANGSIRDQIEVKTLFEVCQNYLHEYEPENDRLYSNETWKSEEHIDEIWEEFYRCELNNAAANVLHPVHDYLIGQGIEAQKYIREEFDWIRSAFEESERDRYLEVERDGRSIPLITRFREVILDGLGAWEAKMQAIGAIDHLGIAAALYRYAQRLEPRYRCALIDESQDFGTIELSIIRKVVSKAENDIFLSGDAAQRVSTKFQSLSKSGISIHGSHVKKIIKNYRNSKEILLAANSILMESISKEIKQFEDFEVLNPEYSSFSSSAPLILKADSLEGELANALAFIKSELADNITWKSCIAICGYSLLEVKQFGKLLGLKVLEGETSMSSDSIFLSDLEQTKGFEFDLMVVVNCTSGVIPDSCLPEKESYRELSRLYVALTRAKSQLIVSYSGSLSIFVENGRNNFLEDNWESYVNIEVVPCDKPKKMADFRTHETKIHPLFMSGPEFLYTKNAIGLSPSLIEKLRELVAGETINRGGHLVKWRNMGSAYDSCKNSPRSRLIFGPEGIKLFRDLCDKLEFEENLKLYKKSDVYQGRSAVGIFD